MLAPLQLNAPHPIQDDASGVTPAKSITKVAMLHGKALMDIAEGIDGE